MTRSILTGPEVCFNKPKPIDTLVVFMHGYGSNGDDLISLASDFAETLPNAMYISPNAPYPFEGMPFPGSYQWGSLREFTKKSLNREINKVLPTIENYLKATLERFSLGADRLVLIGFSQGAYTALSTALYTNVKPRAVLGYSGAFIENPEMPILHKPEICLIHGDMDDVLPVDNLREAEVTFTKLKIPLEAHICRGLGHGISPKGIEIGKQFLTKVFTQGDKEWRERKSH